ERKAIDSCPVPQHSHAAAVERQEAPYEGIGDAPQLVQQHRVPQVLRVPDCIALLQAPDVVDGSRLTAGQLAKRGLLHLPIIASLLTHRLTGGVAREKTRVHV